MRWFLCLAAALLSAPSTQGGAIAGKVTCNGSMDACSAVVYAERIPGLEFHAPRNPVVLDQSNLAFTPHVLPVVAGTTVIFPNHDEVPHNVYSSSPAKIFNVGIYPQGGFRQVTFDEPGEVLLRCNIHPQMFAYVLVVPQPYFATTSPDGKFRLKDLPPGKYKVTVWHERYKPVMRSLEIEAVKTVPLQLDLRELRRNDSSGESQARIRTLAR